MGVKVSRLARTGDDLSHGENGLREFSGGLIHAGRWDAKIPHQADP
jgi:hypothetical protein